MNIKTTLIRKGSEVLLWTKKNSPEILTGIGIVAGVAATGLAVYSTLKCNDILDDHQKKMADISKARYIADHDEEKTITYSAQDEQHDKTVVYVQTGVQFAKLYAPTIILTGLSIAAILSAHNIMQKRYAGVVAAFTALSTKFESYRDRVRKEVGEDKEREFYKSIVTTKAEDPETGKKVAQKQFDDSPLGISRFFDEYSPYWDSNNPDQNICHIRAVLHNANDQLYANGHLFLNDVYRMLGIPDSSEGAVLGWVIDDKHQNPFVDFGVYGPNSDDPWDFTNDMAWDGRMGIKLDFNVDGIVYDKI